MESFRLKPLRRANLMFLRRNWKILALILLAAVLRFLHLLEWCQSEVYGVLFNDSRWYHDTAIRIASGDLLAGERSFFLGPLYAYFLGLWYALFVPNRMVALVIQSILGCLDVLMVYLLGRRLASKATGLVAAALLALYLPTIYYEGLLLMESLLATLMLVGLLLITGSWPRRARLRALAGGMVFGLASTGRPSLLLVTAALALLWLLSGSPAGVQYNGHSSRRLHPRQRIHLPLALVAGTAMVLAMPLARNAIVEREFVPVTSSGGYNFYVGNGPEANGSMAILPWLPVDNIDGGRQYAQQQLGRLAGSSELSRYWLRRALEHIRKHPGRAASLLWWKLKLFWNAVELPHLEWYEFDRTSLTVLSWPLAGFGLLAPLSLAGLLLSWRERRLRVVHVVVLAYVPSIILFFVNARYRIAIVPVLCVLAAWMILWTLQIIRQRHVRAAVLAIALLTVLTWWTGAGGIVLDRQHLLSAHHIRVANKYSELGKNDLAHHHLSEALRLKPEGVRALYGLGVLHRNEGNYEASERVLRQAVAAVPENAEYAYSLAITLHKAGRNDEALLNMGKALQMAPYDARFHEYAGLVLAGMGDDERSAQFFGQSRKLDPARPSVYANMGVLMGRRGHHREAAELFRKAVELDPAYIYARRNLALSCLVLGEVGCAVEQARWLLARDAADSVALHVLEHVKNRAH